jgi:GABA(A) receptor-associated protein
MNYKNTKSFEERIKETLQILKKYPDRIPCILERIDNNNDVPSIDKKKFLVPEDLTMSQFMYVIRKRLNLSPEKAIFIFCNGKLLLNQATMGDIYNENKNKDNYLYLVYSGESTFG